MEATEEQRPLVVGSYPWLFMGDEQHATLFSITENKYYTRIISEIEDKKICTCCNGWLVIQHFTSKDYYLFNPITSENIQLPPLEGNCHLCFLFPSSTDSITLVLFVSDCNDTFYFCQPGDKKFLKQRLERQDYFDLGNKRSFAMLEGKLYCLATAMSCLFVISFEDSQLRIIRLIMENLFLSYYHPCELLDCNYLIESCGELLLIHQVFEAGEAYDFIIFKFNFIEMKWTEIEDIGNSAIFLSNDCKGINCSNATELGMEPNSIYFLVPPERFFYIFDLKDRTLSMILPSPTASRGMKLDWVMLLEDPK